MTQRKEHYVDNKKFYDAMVEYKNSVNHALENNLPKPIISNYIGDCILKISSRVANKTNFIGYAFREEMIGDGIENAIKYIDNFDPEVSKNPFAYFTQIVYYAFLRRIKSEKKHLYTKLKLTEELNTLHLTSEVSDHDSETLYDTAIKHNDWNEQWVQKFISDFEESNIKKRK